MVRLLLVLGCVGRGLTAELQPGKRVDRAFPGIDQRGSGASDAVLEVDAVLVGKSGFWRSYHVQLDPDMRGVHLGFDSVLHLELVFAFIDAIGLA